MAWHLEGTHHCNPNYSFRSDGIYDIIHQPPSMRVPYYTTWQNVELLQAVPPFKKGTVVKTVRYDPGKGCMMIAHGESRYYYQATSTFMPIHDPLDAPCGSCHQFERVIGEDVCMFCKEDALPGDTLPDYEACVGGVNRTVNKMTEHHRWDVHPIVVTTVIEPTHNSVDDSTDDGEEIND